ncbi:single-stranded DNA-binding protein [uncultured Allofournierella sp.]|uniref:single-stranded DNA-binding protein n=1 Tax=uncultured Allofournierella sp. TaxID=1940258 RepID=UPI0025DC99F3|nr:single-stranded DNA-binding protein [uncultured Fournierella sp.]
MICNTKTGLLVAGTVAKAPELKRVGQYARPVLKMSVRYASEKDEEGKNRGKFLDVDIWDNAEELDGMFDKDDAVIVTGGELRSREYNGKTYHSISATGVYPSGGVVFRWIQQVIDMIPAAPAAPINAPDGFQPVGEPVPFDTFEQPATDNAAAGDPNTDFIDEEAEDLPF